MGFFRELIDSEYKELKRFERIAKKIDELSDEMAALSDEELLAEANKWEISHGGLSGRCAQQFIDYIATKA